MSNNTESVTFSARIDDAGRLVIPQPIRKALGFRTGRHVLLRIQDGKLEVAGAEDAWKHAQILARNHPLPRGRRLSDSLIRDRRKAAARSD